METVVKIVKGYYEFVFGLPDLTVKFTDWLEKYEQVPGIVGAVAFTLLFEFLYFTGAPEVILGVVLLVLPIVGFIVGVIVGHLIGQAIVLVFLVLPFLAVMAVLIVGPVLLVLLIAYMVLVFLFSVVIHTN